MTSPKFVELKTKYVEYYAQVPVQRYAAMHIGKSEDTVARWLKVDADFAARVQSAKAAWVEKKMEKIKPEFALERLEKEIFSEKSTVELNQRQEVTADPMLKDAFTEFIKGYTAR